GAHHLMTNVESGKSTLLRQKDAKGRPLPRNQLAEGFAVAGWKDECAWLLQYLNEAVEIARGPEEQQDRRLRKLDARKGKPPPLAGLLLPAVVQLGEMGRRSVGTLRCAAAGVAAERFRRKQGRWPNTLEELVTAGLLAEVPKDPFDGRPLRLRRSADGLVVYSVGPGGKYDGTALDKIARDAEEDPNGRRIISGPSWGRRVEVRLWGPGGPRPPAAP